jgi:acetyl esterase/lipase
MSVVPEESDNNARVWQGVSAEFQGGKMDTKTTLRIATAILSVLATWPALVAAQSDSGSLTRPVISEAIAPSTRIAPIASDGYRGEGFLRKPPGDGPFPAVVFIHGGLTRQPTGMIMRYTLQANASRFLAAGYVIVAITYRSRDVDPQSLVSLADSLAAVEHVKELTYVDPDSVAINGCSGGGDLVLDIAGRTNVAATVSEEPATVLFTGMFNANLPKAGANYTVPDAFPPLTDPVAYYTDEAERITREKTGAITGPVFIIQGDQPLGPAGPDHLRVQNEILLPALESAGVEMKRTIYPGQSHCFAFGGGTAASLAAFEDIDSFLREHIPTQPVRIDPADVEHIPLNAPLQSGITLPAEMLEEYAGTYILAGGNQFEISLDDGQLVVELPGMDPILLDAESESMFFSRYPGPIGLIEFTRAGNGSVTSLIANGDLEAQRQ